MVYYIDWFADIKESLYSWDKAHLVMVYDFFNMLLDSDKHHILKYENAVYCHMMDIKLYKHQEVWYLYTPRYLYTHLDILNIYNLNCLD